MRKWISYAVAALVLIGCGDAKDTIQNNPESSSVSEVAPAGTPKLVLVRVKGVATTMDAVKNGEARVIDASKEDLSASIEAAEKLFATGETVSIADSLDRDDANESSTQSWWFGWGGGYRSLGFGWPGYSYYRPYSYYNPFYYTPAYVGGACGASYYSPYYYGGYSYYPYFW